MLTTGLVIPSETKRPLAVASTLKLFIMHSFLLQGKQLDELADAYMDVGFRFYLIFNRMIDVDPKLLNNPKRE